MTVVRPAPPLLAHRVDAELRPDPGRVVTQLFLPGEERLPRRSRAAAIIDRVLALSEPEAEQLALSLVSEFADRHRDYEQTLHANARVAGSHMAGLPPMTPSRNLVMGAVFTAEYAVEGAALCNPSAVQHPDQSGLQPGQLRVAVSLRAIGEGHLSSVGFAEAVVGPGPRWAFEPRALPVVAGVSSGGRWRRDHLRAVLVDRGPLSELTSALLARMPEVLTAADLQEALLEQHRDLTDRFGIAAAVDRLRQLVASAYDVTFPDDVALSQQVLRPTSPDESNGMEDARFTRFVDAHGQVEYRATYTAYDGQNIAPRVLTSSDLRTFEAHRLAGPAARNKGMALFPRTVGGRHLALCRSDGESSFVAASDDGLVWGEPQLVQPPCSSWELLQVGNCGPPVETDRGWVVLTHGVGPMRRYTIGAILLDLDRPERLIGRLARPLLVGAAGEQEGYVPNVLYSCGGIQHDGRIWIPYGIGDARIAVAWVDVADVLEAMIPVDPQDV